MSATCQALKSTCVFVEGNKRGKDVVNTATLTPLYPQRSCRSIKLIVQHLGKRHLPTFLSRVGWGEPLSSRFHPPFTVFKLAHNRQKAIFNGQACKWYQSSRPTLDRKKRISLQCQTILSKVLNDGLGLIISAFIFKSFQRSSIWTQLLWQVQIYHTGRPHECNLSIIISYENYHPTWQL